uniref:Nonstructural protein n=1 Tax=Parvoviridae sp. TaxID=1940570 RepID=A0A7D3UH55_9VIRU|nr:MAG: nonstructural protein [Parvoviridae sp.]
MADNFDELMTTVYLPTGIGYSCVFRLPFILENQGTSHNIWETIDSTPEEEFEWAKGICEKWHIDAKVVEDWGERQGMGMTKKHVWALAGMVRCGMSSNKWNNVEWVAQFEVSPNGFLHCHLLFWGATLSPYMARGLVGDAGRRATQWLNTKLQVDQEVKTLINGHSELLVSLNKTKTPTSQRSPTICSVYAWWKAYYANKSPLMVTEFSVTGEFFGRVRSGDATHWELWNVQPTGGMQLQPRADLQLPPVSVKTDDETGSHTVTLTRSKVVNLSMAIEKACKEKDIWTLEDIGHHCPLLWRNFMSLPGGKEKLGQELFRTRASVVRDLDIFKKIEQQKTLPLDFDPTKNKVVKLFNFHKYNPMIAAALISGWCKKGWGKRNTLVLTGLASTGKTCFAHALCESVKIYGMVNHNNMSFPFNDCVNTLLNHWEEAVMTEEHVETAKCLMDGSRVRVDVKHQGSVAVSGTPMLVTSNHDIFVVKSKNTTTSIHEGPLRSRCITYHFVRQLPEDWGRIDKGDMMDFILWGDSLDLTMEDILRVTGKNDLDTGVPRSVRCVETCFDVLKDGPGNSYSICDCCGAFRSDGFIDKFPELYTTEVEEVLAKGGFGALSGTALDVWTDHLSWKSGEAQVVSTLHKVCN